MPEDYDDIFHYIIEINSRIRDWPYDEKYGKIYMGWYFPAGAQSSGLSTHSTMPISAAQKAPNPVCAILILKYTDLHTDANLRNYNMEQDFRPAIEREDFKLYLQPKVDLRTGEITEAEALVRWIDPEKGMIPVSEFLPELEKNGLIGDLDYTCFSMYAAPLTAGF